MALFRFILHAKKTGFVVEHDFIMATYLADRVIVFEGEPSISTEANTPQVGVTAAGCTAEDVGWGVWRTSAGRWYCVFCQIPCWVRR